ncbi:cysteine rich repeat-containing protein [Methylibium sp.]|uniref:cysteine rich repeat-containing protein n=1 Tax=Methylibium sp. TaxID=2067992 RepID=UPI003D0E869E
MKASQSIAMLAAALWLAAAPLAAADGPGQRACGDDLRRHCGDVRPGGGRAVACLQQHQAELSGSCQAALPVLARCSAEIRSVCGEAAAPRELRACMRQETARLSAECRGAAGAR